MLDLCFDFHDIFFEFIEKKLGMFRLVLDLKLFLDHGTSFDSGSSAKT